MRINRNNLIIYLYEKGYRATPEGEIISPITGMIRKKEYIVGITTCLLGIIMDSKQK